MVVVLEKSEVVVGDVVVVGGIDDVAGNLVGAGVVVVLWLEQAKLSQLEAK